MYMLEDGGLEAEDGQLGALLGPHLEDLVRFLPLRPVPVQILAVLFKCSRSKKIGTVSKAVPVRHQLTILSLE